jgi:alpha-D-xyloside xylohydrolase
LSFADISSRAVQGRIDSPECDLFFFAGETPERILYQYRKITGFPPTVPAWSYGVWMSRMTYFSADEIEEIAKRMRSESYPCDVLHIDTGWFETDWVCEWKFSKERFPDPQGFMGRLKDQGFRVSLWQTPNIGKGNCLYDEAVAKRILPPIRTEKAHVDVVSDFSGQDMGGQIDFTNAEAVTWYQEKIRRLLQMGAAAIKTDFGEKILMRADFLHMDTSRLHNLYGLLYQKAAFEETVRTTGEGLIWARSGWAGCQRYPLHWGGDAAATWDGMAATLRGGLQLGLSGFGYWSHDIPGFHGLPEFMNTAPSDTLYMRWTQMGVFTSHMRYHGTSAREPWHFPRISDDIRKWFNLRYRLIPYFLEQGRICANSGYPMLRALHLMHPDDPVCWNIDDQFYCGDSFLVCPVMNDSGVRNVYLPHGSWVDFFSGERLSGGRYLMQVASPLDRLPVYCPEGARIPIYPEIVQCTDDMDWNKVTMLSIDAILVPDTNIQ